MAMNVEHEINRLTAGQSDLDSKIARLATIAEMQIEAHDTLAKETAERFREMAERQRQTDEQIKATDRQVKATGEYVKALGEDIRLLFKVVGNHIDSKH